MSVLLAHFEEQTDVQGARQREAPRHRSALQLRERVWVDESAETSRKKAQSLFGVTPREIRSSRDCCRNHVARTDTVFS